MVVEVDELMLFVHDPNSLSIVSKESSLLMMYDDTDSKLAKKVIRKDSYEFIRACFYSEDTLSGAFSVYQSGIAVERHVFDFPVCCLFTLCTLIVWHLDRMQLCI